MIKSTGLLKIIYPLLGEVCNAIDDNVYTCCSASNQCDRNQGDCDSDSECSGDLICGSNNCKSPFPIDADCCEAAGNSKFVMCG